MPNIVSYFLAGYAIKMNILVPNINRSGQKGLSFKVRLTAYRACWHAL